MVLPIPGLILTAQILTAYIHWLWKYMSYIHRCVLCAGVCIHIFFHKGEDISYTVISLAFHPLKFNFHFFSKWYFSSAPSFPRVENYSILWLL